MKKCIVHKLYHHPTGDHNLVLCLGKGDGPKGGTYRVRYYWEEVTCKRCLAKRDRKLPSRRRR